ncbi:MAG: hypothetical protein HYY18_05770 [Planctomycetes bacterium]|nr:hypothetical protein [Planctomycetota bacterium]
MKTIFAVLSFVLAVTPPVSADDRRPGKPDAEAVKELVKNLGSESADARDRAEARLAGMGAAVLEDLKREREGDLGKDPEVRARLDKIIAKFESEAARTILREAAVRTADTWCAAQVCPRCAKKGVWKAEELTGESFARLFPRTIFFWLRWTCCPPDKYKQVPSELLAVGSAPDETVELTDYSKLPRLDPWLAPALTDESAKDLGAAIAGLCRCIGSERKPVFAPPDGTLEVQPSGERTFDAGGLMIPFSAEGRMKPLIIYAR